MAAEDKHPDRWPVDAETGNPIPPKAQPGYYPGYSILGQQDFWEEATRNVVLARLHQVPPIRFFYTYGPHPVGEVGSVLIRGCVRLGIRVCVGGPVAILSGSHGDRPHCIYRGFCIQGCKVGAKQSTLVSHVPDALANGAEIRDHCMVARIKTCSFAMGASSLPRDPPIRASRFKRWPRARPTTSFRRGRPCS